MADKKDSKDRDTTPETPGAMSGTPSELAAQDVADNDTTSQDTGDESASFFARMSREAR